MGLTNIDIVDAKCESMIGPPQPTERRNGSKTHTQ